MVPCPPDNQTCNEGEGPLSQVDYGLPAIRAINRRLNAPVAFPA